MGRLIRARFYVEREDAETLVIVDDGDHARVPTVTNDAEAVVAALHQAGILKGRKLLYRDSEGALDELRHDRAGRFLGFAPGPGRGGAA